MDDRAGLWERRPLDRVESPARKEETPVQSRTWKTVGTDHTTDLAAVLCSSLGALSGGCRPVLGMVAHQGRGRTSTGRWPGRLELRA